MPHLEGTQLGRYTLVERIGRGGMSEVYRAQPDDGSPAVALKVLRIDADDPENRVFVERFKREASIIAELDHPHILKIFDYDQEGEFVYFAMPIIAGGTLVDVVRAGASQPEAVCHWLQQIASALDHAHKLEVVHRDLKPGNVLLDEHGDAYLTDFGIALLTTHTSNLTQTGIVIGTPAYMAPEQWRDEPLDGRADVYGLAVMVYLLLTLHTPFEAAAAHAMMHDHLNLDPRPMRHFKPELSEALDQVILKALAKNREDRYLSAGMFAEDFIRAVEGKLVSASPKFALATTHALAATPSIAIPPVNPDEPKAYPIPAHLHQALAQKSARRAQRLLIGGGLALLLILAAFAGLFLLNNKVGSTSEVSPTPLSPTRTPAPTNTPNDRPPNPPRVLIRTPVNGDVFALGQEIIIQVEAFDPAMGITRVEVRRFGEVLDEILYEGNPKQVSAEFFYTPPSAGVYYLEIIAYRGDLAGNPDVVQVEVQ